jgi:membrane-associated phospholipid phosphatase
MTAPATDRTTWSLVVESLNRPYRVTIPLVALVALVPLYVFIAAEIPGRAVHVPALPVDRAVPLQPAWAIVYGALYLFLILLPVFVVRQDELLRRTVLAYLAVWVAAYVSFMAYPTVAPRPAQLAGEGFGVWGLRILYDADPPFNCFPSLHVAHSFVSALACYRVHRALGTTAVGCASLVALSTLFTKQHYVADVIAGALMAVVAYRIFLHRHPRDTISDPDRHLAPVFALCVIGVACLGLAGFWIAYVLTAPA